MAKKAKKTKKVKKTVKKTVKKAVKKKTAKKKAATKKKQTKKASVKKRAIKKSTPKKTAKRKKAVRIRRKSTLTPAEIEHFKELLFKKRGELIGDVNSIESEALKKSRLDAAGDLSSMPIHMADIGTDNFEQEFALGLMDSERKMLNEINEALNRIDAGVYGICEGTQKPIAKARLNASPWARYCIKYATMIEKGLVIEGEEIYDEEDEDLDQLDEFEQAEELEETDKLEETGNIEDIKDLHKPKDEDEF